MRRPSIDFISARHRTDRSCGHRSAQLSPHTSEGFDEIDGSEFGRFNSLIVDSSSLFVRFISLFGRVGNYIRVFCNINDLPAWDGSPNDPESRFSLYLPVHQGTRSASIYSAASPFSR